jgi:hypothetical protein
MITKELNDKLCELARDITHRHGFAWYDPRTGKMIPPPKKGKSHGRRNSVPTRRSNR